MIRLGLKSLIPGAHWAPSSNQNLQTFPFTENMDNRGFGYDGFFDKITTHGQSHLSLLREFYQKNDLKRKVTAVNLKVSFTVGFCLFFFFWLLSFLLFVKSRWEATILLHAFLSSSSLSSTHIKSLPFCFSIFYFSLCSFHLHPTYIFSCSTYCNILKYTLTVL